MNNGRHPQHAPEQRRLSTTITAIDRVVQQLRDLGWSGGAAAHATFQVRKWGWEKGDRLLEIRSNPYFGRIDRQSELGQLESFYIGPEGLRNPDGGDPLIIDWRAPISAAFYQPDESTQLKRQLDIKDTQLVRIIDELVRSLEQGEVSATNHADPLLHEILSQAKGGELGSIIRTIQSQQDELIRASENVLVVQGAAGAGKTVVALHRIAYLLYQARAEHVQRNGDIQSDLPAQRRNTGPRPVKQLNIAAFGPNKSYLRHIRPTLPSLGEHGVVETTFDEWIRRAQIDDRLESLVHDDDLEEILDASLPRDQRKVAFKRAQNKGSLAMGELLARSISLMLTGHLNSIQSEPVHFLADVAASPVPFRVTAHDMDASGRLARGAPLNHIREVIRDRLRQAVLEQLEHNLAQRNLSTSRTGNARQYNHVFDQFSAEFDRRWPKTHAASFYTHLLSNEADLDEAADETGIEAPTLLTDGAKLRMEDIPPLAYLSYLIDGAIPMYPPGEPETVWTSLDHAVIDEAQDLAPLALKLIRAHAHGLTVLGDMNQTVYSHRGTRSWQEVMDALGSEAGQIRVLGVSYRSTLPITDLANSVVRNGRLKGGESQPFARVGPPPTLRAAKHEAELVGTVTQFVVQAIEDGSKSVAVLTRTAARARSLQNEMKDQLPAPSICVTDRQDDRDAPIVVMPAYLAKGIEFDTVAVVDVDAITYTQVQNDAAVLYVAITRALNNLLLVWVGTPSSLIAARDPEDRIKNEG